jgi:hypothetical protein
MSKYVHYVERLYEAATREAEGHFPEAEHASTPPRITND